MSDSNMKSPPPDDSQGRKRPARRKEADDDVVDLNQYEPAEEGSAVLSHSGHLSGPISGSSIVSWDELARAHSHAEGDDLDLDDRGEIDFDSASDIDLLHQVLSNDPPPSNIILKDPSSPETPALPPDDDTYDAAESALDGFDEQQYARAAEGSRRSWAVRYRTPRRCSSNPPRVDRSRVWS